MASYLITGSSRGIGLELATQLANRPADQVRLVIATARASTAPGLQKLTASHPERVKFVQLDVASADSVKRAADEVEGLVGSAGLDVLVNNAGMMPWTPDGILAMDELDEVFHTNVTAVHMVTRSLIPLLKKGSKKAIINMCSVVGSISMADMFIQTPVPAYKISKAALDMLTVQYSHELGKDGFRVIALSPGWVKTDMGSEYADLTPAESGKAILKIVDAACQGATMNGRFYNIHVPGWEVRPGRDQYNGAELPW